MSLLMILKHIEVKVICKFGLQFSLCLVLIYLSACSESVHNNPTMVIDDARNEVINKVCDSLLASTPEMTGMIVGIWDATKNINYVKGFGIADKLSNQTVATDMLSRVGSVTKTFTTTLVLQMIDRGQLDLSDNVTMYLPEYPQLSEITIEMLCNMTSGIFDYTDDKDFIDLFLAEMDSYQAPEKLVERALKNFPLCSPGTEYHYCSTNTILLGMIIEKICGKKFEQVLHDNILAPFGLAHTYLPLSKEMPSNNFLHGYVLGLDFGELAHPSWAWAAGGIVSNIYDLKKWIEIVVKGNILSPHLQEKRFSNPVSNPDRVYGLGISSIGYNLWGHSGTIPGYETIMMTDRINDRTYVIFFNTYSEKTSPESLLKRILEIID